MAVVIIPAPAIVASISNFPANQPVTVTNTPLPISGNVSITGGVSVSNFPPTPAPVVVDAQAFDDDGNPYVNPNVPGADIATGDRQMQQLAVLQQLAVGVPASQQGPWTVAVSATPAPILAQNQAQETAGQLQRVGDLLESLLIELRAHTLLLANLNQPVQEDPDKIRSDMNLSLQ
jgi:hypothetical protein